MAEEWIRVNAKLLNHPKLFRITKHINDSHPEKAVTNGDALCGLLRTWCAINEHARIENDDALVHYCDTETIDSVAQLRGLGAAMVSVGWAIEEPGSIVRFPHFLVYNIPPDERRRIKDRERKVRTRCGQSADKKRTMMTKKGVQNRTEQNSSKVVTNVTTLPETAPARMAKPRSEKQAERDALWDAVKTSFFPSGTSKADDSLIGKTVTALRAKNALPDEIPKRLARWPTLYPDAGPLTPVGLAKHWDALGTVKEIKPFEFVAPEAW